MNKYLVLIDREHERFVINDGSDDSHSIRFKEMSTPEMLLQWIGHFSELPNTSHELIQQLIIAYSGIFSDATSEGTPLSCEIGWIYHYGHAITIDELRKRVVAFLQNLTITKR